MVGPGRRNQSSHTLIISLDLSFFICQVRVMLIPTRWWPSEDQKRHTRWKGFLIRYFSRTVSGFCYYWKGYLANSSPASILILHTHKPQTSLWCFPPYSILVPKSWTHCVVIICCYISFIIYCLLIPPTRPWVPGGQDYTLSLLCPGLARRLAYSRYSTNAHCIKKQLGLQFL